MRHEFHPEALTEFEAAARHYADCQDGLELRFITCVEETITQIIEAPLRCRLFSEDVRRCLTPIFPYAVLYTLELDYVLVISIMHCHRKPGYWRHRLKRKH